MFFSLWHPFDQVKCLSRAKTTIWPVSLTTLFSIFSVRLMDIMACIWQTICLSMQRDVWPSPIKSVDKKSLFALCLLFYILPPVVGLRIAGYNPSTIKNIFMMHHISVDKVTAFGPAKEWQHLFTYDFIIFFHMLYHKWSFCEFWAIFIYITYCFDLCKTKI